MDCRECRDKLSLYLDGQLTETERLRVEAEIESCPDCAREFEEFSLLVSDLKAVGPAPARDGLLDDLRAAFRAELEGKADRGPARGGFFRHFGPWRSIAAGLLLALSFLVIARDRGYFADRAGPERMEATESEAREIARRAPGSEEKEDRDDESAFAPEGLWQKGEDAMREEASTAADDGAMVEDEREERLLAGWRGFLDRVGGAARERGMDLVEPRGETERFLAGYGAGPAGGTTEAAPGAPMAAVGSGRDKKGVATAKSGGLGGDIRAAAEDERGQGGQPKGAAESRPAQARPDRPDLGYIVMGEGALARLEAELRSLGAEVRTSPIVALAAEDGRPARDAGVEVEVLLSEAEIATLIARLERTEGLALRLYARREAAASRPAAVSRKLLLLFILPRP